jgi:hypothetical protein
MKRKPRRRSRSRRSPQPAAEGQARPEVRYPIATVAYYGPDDRTVTKIAVGIVEDESAEPIMERWIGPDVTTNPEVQVQIAGFIQAHGVQQVVTTDSVLGCPHEEGIDFPAGQECPYCPFWRGKQGIQVADEAQDADPYQEMKSLTRKHMRLVWEGAQLNMPFSGEKARLAKVMREHPEYSHLWERLDELTDEEIEQGGVNPILHVTTHLTIENQIADENPKEVRRVVEALMQQGLSRHEAIHQVGRVLSEEIFHLLNDERPFDEAGYIRKLRRLVR